MEKIIQHKISADHLLYVSLKYTKTTQVMENLIKRWVSLTEMIIEKLLEKSKKDKKISKIPEAPILKIKMVKNKYRDKEIKEAMELFLFFRKIPELEKTREGEFRKNVALTVKFKGEWTRIDLDKLKEYNEKMEDFLEKSKSKL